jgi:hypothetical protein
MRPCDVGARSSALASHFGHRVKAVRRKPGSTWHLDEMFVTQRGEPCLLWRAAHARVSRPEARTSVLSNFGPIRQHFALK